MCLIVFAYRCYPGQRLLLAANRDEFFERPTAPLGFHYPGERILAGRDLRAGGTWLALAADGRFGAITNYRNPARRLPSPPSRGEIILDYLRSSLSARDFLLRFEAGASRYEGFNLLLGDRQDLLYFSNINREISTISPGIYGLSNHLLDTPWPKVKRVKKLFGSLVKEQNTVTRYQVFSLLGDTSCPPDEVLPDTGVGLDWERRLAPIFIAAPGYGTRSSSFLAIDEFGRVELCERSYENGLDCKAERDRCCLLTAGTFSPIQGYP